MQATVARPLDPDLPFKVSCKICGHVKVCGVFRAIGPLLSKNWDDDTRPFEPEQIAVICREFISASIIETLRKQT